MERAAMVPIAPTTIAPTLTLEAFLAQPETEPASEFLTGEVTQKPMPQGKHSRLQFKLCQVIAAAVEEAKIAGVFPELGCTFGGASIVPDVAVVRWERIPRDPSGDLPELRGLPLPHFSPGFSKIPTSTETNSPKSSGTRNPPISWVISRCSRFRHPNTQKLPMVTAP